MGAKTLPQVVTDIYNLLNPLESDDRQKVFSSVMTLLGESAVPKMPLASGSGKDMDPERGVSFGVKALRWMKQNGVTSEMLEEIYHAEDGHVEIIASSVPGKGKKGPSTNCYLLAGIKALLKTDEAKFQDAEAVELCKHMGCYDQANHAATRSGLGNITSGTKNTGFTLPAPGLRAAADLIKVMSS